MGVPGEQPRSSANGALWKLRTPTVPGPDPIAGRLGPLSRSDTAPYCASGEVQGRVAIASGTGAAELVEPKTRKSKRAFAMTPALSAALAATL